MRCWNTLPHPVPPAPGTGWIHCVCLTSPFRAMRRVLLLFLVLMIGGCNLISKPENEKGNPDIARQIRQWGKQLEDFNPERPTVLFATDVSTCFACGGAGINEALEEIKQSQLNVNTMVVIAVEAQGEAEVFREAFRTRNIVEDLEGALEKLFKLTVFPTAVIISPKGAILHTHPDPTHNPLTVGVLLTYLDQKPQTLSNGQKLSATGGMLVDIDWALPQPERNRVILCDRSQNALFLFEPDHARYRLLWKSHDSLLFSPVISRFLQLPNSPEARAKLQSLIAKTRKFYPTPFVSLSYPLYIRDDTLCATLSLSYPTENGAAITLESSNARALFLLREHTAELVHLDSLPTFPSSLGAAHPFLWQGELFVTGEASTEFHVALYQYRQGKWTAFASFPFAPSDTQLSRQFQIQPLPLTTPNLLALVSPRLPAIVGFIRHHQKLDTLYIPLAGKLARISTTWQEKAREALEEVKRIAKLLGVDTPRVALSIPLDGMIVNDSTLCVIVYPSQELRIDYPAVQFYSPSGFLREILYAVSPPAEKEVRTDSKAFLSGRELLMLVKWKPSGWYMYRVNLAP